MKNTVTIEKLRRHGPIECAKYLQYFRALHFLDKPSYTYLQTLLRDAVKNVNYADSDLGFDWMHWDKKIEYNKKSNPH